MSLPDDSGPLDGPLDGLGTGDTLFVGLVVAFVVVVAVVTLVLVVRNVRLMRSSGLDPTALHGMLSRSRALAPEPTLEQRLDELDRLHRAGKITDEERTSARAELLSGD